MTKGDPIEILDQDVIGRVQADVASALKRRPLHEARLAGVVRALAPYSQALRDSLVEAATLLVKRESFDRELYGAVIRALAEAGDDRVAPIIAQALSTEEYGGFATVSAACFVRDAALSQSIARVATSRHAHMAFAAEIARMSRRESDGAHLMTLAPKIKESHRISLCVEIFVPLSRGMVLPTSVGPALTVLRDAERHLGRWLVLGEVAVHAGDISPLEEAKTKAKSGPSSARSAWALVAWALSGDSQPPSTRPTVELVARLSDRPSADRDTTFLFRLAEAKSPAVRPMLEGLVKALPLSDELSIRASLYLARDHEREDLRTAIEVAARAAKREDVRGLALAALWDSGANEKALEFAEEISKSRSLPTAAWGALVKAVAAAKSTKTVVDEATFRRTQWAWLE
jgi:hypothetical protein